MKKPFGWNMPRTRGPWRSPPLREAWDAMCFAFELTYRQWQHHRTRKALYLAKRRLPWYEANTRAAIDIVIKNLKEKDRDYERLIDSMNKAVGERIARKAAAKALHPGQENRN